MGCYPIGSAVCNNCVHWQCHSERKFQGSPVRNVYTTSNCDRCSITQRTTLSSNTCARFSHIGGISVGGGFARSIETVDPGSAFLTAALDYARETRAMNMAMSMLNRVLDDDDNEVVRIRSDKSQSLRRKLVSRGMSTSASGDEVSEFKVLLENAAKGEAQAQYYLAYCFWRGEHGAERNYKRAAHWCWKAACQDHADAENLMGRFYHDGIGVGRNLEKASALYERAAQRGCAVAVKNYRITRREIDG